MPRSVMVPSSLPSSTTGIIPASVCSISLAASTAGLPAPTVCGLGVITSRMLLPTWTPFVSANVPRLKGGETSLKRVDEPEGDDGVLQRHRRDDEQVEDLVVAEHGRERIGAAARVADAAERVAEPAGAPR